MDHEGMIPLPLFRKATAYDEQAKALTAMLDDDLGEDRVEWGVWRPDTHEHGGEG